MYTENWHSLADRLNRYAFSCIQTTLCTFNKLFARSFFLSGVPVPLVCAKWGLISWRFSVFIFENNHFCAPSAWCRACDPRPSFIQHFGPHRFEISNFHSFRTARHAQGKRKKQMKYMLALCSLYDIIARLYIRFALGTARVCNVQSRLCECCECSAACASVCAPVYVNETFHIHTRIPLQS